MQPVTLHTARLTLIGYSPEDIRFIFENNTQTEAMMVLGHQTLKDYEQELEKVQKGYACYNRQFISFLLKHNETRQIAGRCSLHNWNKEHRRAELGYAMTDDRFKRQGLMSEAAEAVIAYGFDVLNLHRIEALVGPDNVPSMRIVQKNRFVQEGVLRQHYLVDGVFDDSVCFGLLHSEYAAYKHQYN